jgi:hypothetical protein
MGFRFRKSVKLFPGVKINLGKTGVTTTIGGPGASINVGKRGTRGTVGIPGTGISYSENLSPSQSPSNRLPSPKATAASSGRGLIWIVLIIFIVVILLKILK